MLNIFIASPALLKYTAGICIADFIECKRPKKQHKCCSPSAIHKSGQRHFYLLGTPISLPHTAFLSYRLSFILPPTAPFPSLFCFLLLQRPLSEPFPLPLFALPIPCQSFTPPSPPAPVRSPIFSILLQIWLVFYLSFHSPCIPQHGPQKL
jgi:hypothetical protein